VKPGEDAALYDTVQRRGPGTVPGPGHRHPGGQGLFVDAYALAGRERRTHQVTAPVSLVVTAFATLADVRGTLTPQLQPVDSTLDVDRSGPGPPGVWPAACWRKCWGSSATTVPDLDDARLLKQLVAAINTLRAQGRILAYHDRSDGGLWAAVCEMAFAGQRGVSLNVDILVTEGDGISDSRPILATPRTGPARWASGATS
jgi:phosphoribosylformylglycinamidine synthase